MRTVECAASGRRSADFSTTVRTVEAIGRPSAAPDAVDDAHATFGRIAAEAITPFPPGIPLVLGSGALGFAIAKGHEQIAEAERWAELAAPPTSRHDGGHVAGLPYCIVQIGTRSGVYSVPVHGVPQMCR